MRAGSWSGARHLRTPGRRAGVMSTVISMAYAATGPVMHLSSSAKHLEEIRRVTSRVSEMVMESERARLSCRMLSGSTSTRVPRSCRTWRCPRRGCPPRGQARGRPVDRVPCRRRRGPHPARSRRHRRRRSVARSGGAALAPSRRHGAGQSRLERPRRGMVRAGSGDAEGCVTISRRPSRWRPTAPSRGAREALARLALEASRFVAPDRRTRRCRSRRAIRDAGQGPARRFCPGTHRGAHSRRRVVAVLLARGEVGPAAMARSLPFEAGGGARRGCQPGDPDPGGGGAAGGPARGRAGRARGDLAQTLSGPPRARRREDRRRLADGSSGVPSLSWPGRRQLLQREVRNWIGELVRSWRSSTSPSPLSRSTEAA